MTILGKHTVSETRDLIKVVQNRFQEVEKGFQRITPEWQAANPDPYRLLKLDWEKEKAHWSEESDAVATKLTILNTVNAAPASVIPAEDEYKRILGFVEYGASSGVERRAGDLRDCELRIEKALGQQLLYGRPDMNSTDADSAALKKLDASIKAGEAAAAKAAAAAKDAAKSNTGLLIIGGAGLLFGVYVYAKLS